MSRRLPLLMETEPMEACSSGVFTSAFAELAVGLEPTTAGLQNRSSAD